MTTPKTWIGVRKLFEKAPEDVREYFPHFSDLLEAFPLEVCLAYAFARVERAKHMTIYCGIMKLHDTEAELTRRAVDTQHMSRGTFKDLFRTIYGKPIEASSLASLEKAEKVRDLVLHGKEYTDANAREALAHVIAFAETFNAFVEKTAGLRPFGNLKGFKGRGKSLSQKTTRWILKGMGLTGV